MPVYNATDDRAKKETWNPVSEKCKANSNSSEAVAPGEIQAEPSVDT